MSGQPQGLLPAHALSVGSSQPIVLCKQTIPNAGTILWWCKMVLTLAVIFTLLNFILWLAFVGYTLSNGELVLFINSIV